MENVRCTSSVSISGTVLEEPVLSNTIFGENFYDFQLGSKRISGIEDTLVIQVSDRVIDVASIKKGMSIKVSGRMSSFNKRTPNEERTKLLVFVFANEICLDYDSDSESDVNDVKMTGYICNKRSKRYIHKRDTHIIDFMVAVQRGYKKSSYIPCIAWGRNADFIDKLEKGTEVSVRGRLQSRVFGDNQTAYEVSLTSISLCESKEEKSDEVEEERN